MDVNDSVVAANKTAEDVKEEQILWVMGEVILVIIMIFTIYVFVSLLHYSWRRRNAVGVSGNIVEARERFLRHSCSIAIFIAIVRCALHQGVVSMKESEETYLDRCRDLLAASKTVYNLAVCLMYVYFWLRQRNFYSIAELKVIRTTLLEVVDWFCLCLIVVVSGAIAIVAYIPSIGGRSYNYHEDKCEVFEYSDKYLLLVYGGLSCVFQLTLLGLYVYPLVYLKRQLKLAKKNPKEYQQINANKAVYPSLKRSLIMLIICIVTDVIAVTAASRLTKHYPELFVSILALYDINLVIKVTCAICTFRNWRKIIFGFPIVRQLVDTREAVAGIPKRSSVQRKLYSNNNTENVSV